MRPLRGYATEELSRGPRLALALAILALTMAWAPAARAQLHWDASARVGVAKRHMSDRTGADAGFGPAAELMAHVAVFPLLRAGLYVDHDTSPQGTDAPARRFFGGGARLRIFSPWPRGKARAWLFLRGGALLAHAPSYTTTLEIRDTPQSAPVRRQVDVGSASGRALDLGGGLGASYTLWGPWQLSAELGARAPLALTGDLYDGRSLTGGGVLAPAGVDQFVTTLTVGITYDP
jgi:hypothetical protein